MQKDKMRQACNLLFAVAQPIVAVLVNLEITGPGIGRISDRYPTYVVPAGYAFLIWNLIFALSLGYGVWQALPAQRENLLLRRVGWLTAAALASTSLWMLVFQHTLFLLSIGVMLCLLAALIGVVERTFTHGTQTRTEQWLVYVTFSIFLGWITVATVANVGQVLTAYAWSGWGLMGETWGIIALVAAGLIAAAVTYALRGNAAYALTIIWAFIAVAVKQYERAVPTSSTTVGTVAVAMFVLVGAALLLSLTRRGAWRGLHTHSPART